MASRGFSKSQNQPSRTQAQKRSQTRRVLLETLERRELFAVGPQLLGIQTNGEGLLQNGDVLNTSPNEIIFRFDDASGIDASTLSGIRLVRSGEDGSFDRASVATDFGTNGTTLVEFYAKEAGAAGNGITLQFSKANRSDSRNPVITVSGTTINVQLNSNPTLQTRVSDLLRAFDPNTSTAATQLVYAQRLRGSETVGIGSTVDTTRSYVLSGANAAKGSTDFGFGAGVEVRFLALDSGSLGAGTTISITSRDFGGPGLPIVSAEGQDVSIELNSNARYATTIQQFIDAINAVGSESASVISADLVSGGPSTRIGGQPARTVTLVGGGADIQIAPAYVGLGDTGREVIMRFAQALPDDQYTLEFLGKGVRTLRSVDGNAYNGGISTSVSFSLDRGAQIESIVPQPIVRNTSGVLEQRRDQVDVYFNDDKLINVDSILTVNGLSVETLKASRPVFYLESTDTIVFKAGAVASKGVLNSNYYQLFATRNTLNSLDDSSVKPTSIRYYIDANYVQLKFGQDLATLPNATLGEMRLRIGSDESAPLPPLQITPAADPSDTFAAATPITGWTPGVSGSPQSVLLNSSIVNTSAYQLDFPGGPGELGDRINRYQNNIRTIADNVDGMSIVYYNFQTTLGTSSTTTSTSTLTNAITDPQKLRVREVLSIWEKYLGVRFIETSSRGITIGVGDTRAVTPFSDSADGLSPGVRNLNAAGLTYFEAGTLIATGQPAAILDFQDFTASDATLFGGTFQRAAMQAIGLTLGLGFADELSGFNIMSFNSVFAPAAGSEIVLPGQSDIIAGQYVYRPDSKDIDLYQFAIPVDGRVSIETFAERLNSSSLLDTAIRLYQQQANGSWVEIAMNDDYFSNDSLIEVELRAGNYIVGVSASGNTDYTGEIADSGLGGTSEGSYQMRIDFTPPAPSILRDATGTAIDGDSDGTPGGIKNFWFRAATADKTFVVDKSVTTSGTGSISSPFKTISAALSAATAGSVIRIVGNAGADGNMATTADNLAYEIGFNTLGGALPDGSSFVVPKDVSVMIDAGAILKLRRARIGVGSTTVSVDRSGGSLLVLGTPSLVTSTGAMITDSSGSSVPGDVYFTSANDRTLGKNANNSVVGSTPAGGDWGGLDLRNRIDDSQNRYIAEEAGIFLNSIMHADIRYGGGQVVVDGVSQVITPVQLIDSRPTIAYSTITNSSDAAISATPNSFGETNFHSPTEQAISGVSFTVDYDRAGPEINNNTILNNSVNGLQLKLQTAGSSQLEVMTVTGRFDDTDIVHIIPENLTIAGTPGGATLIASPPPSAQVNLRAITGGTLNPFTNYSYKFTGIDSSGNETIASEGRTESAFSLFGPNFTSGSIQLSNLPSDVRKIYRSDGLGDYLLIATFTSPRSTFTDNGIVGTTLLVEPTPQFTNRLNASLAVDAGTVVKMKGSRIDVLAGAQLLAEGTDGKPVVFTSIDDNRYGGSGTFATTSTSSTTTVTSGSWGGIYIENTSRASIDNAVLAYGGGVTRIEGGFAGFNVVEVHQGELRLTNSRIELNAAGTSDPVDSVRAGRGPNTAATIFVLGSQPVIAGNTIIGNLAPAINVDVNSLNANLLSDYGRSTGNKSLVTNLVGNRGPLIVGNMLENNSTNGMVIRGGVLATEGVWDDTDIVHVMESNITVGNIDTFGGLKLLSKADASLVVKMANEAAGFTTTGVTSDNEDRIGGTINLVGTPSYPVILTSIGDCDAGAGFTLSGNPQTDTANSCSVVVGDQNIDIVLLLDDTGSFTSFGPSVASVFSNVVAEIQAQAPTASFAFSVSRFEDYATVGGGSSDRAFILNQPIITTGTANFTEAIEAALNRSAPGGGGDGPESAIEALWQIATGAGYDENNDGDTDDSGPAGLVSTQTNPGAGGDIPAYSSFTPDPTGPVLPASGSLGGVGFRPGSTRIVLLATDIGTAYQPDGSTTITGKDGVTVPVTDFDIGGRDTTPNGTGATIQGTIDQLIANNIKVIGLSANTTSETLVNNLAVLTGATDAVGDGLVFNVSGLEPAELTTTLVSAVLSGSAATNWQGVNILANSNDRNVALATENESNLSNAGAANNTPATAQYLGQLAPNELSGDENQRLGFQVDGVISKPNDYDVYSFSGTSGTEVWIDIDRTQNSLDTVVELIDADGNILALSNDSFLEESDPSLLVNNAGLIVNPLRKSPLTLYPSSALGAPKDLYSTNPKDAGMRVILPGTASTKNLYHIRVRSSSTRTGSTAELQNTSNSGLTRGNYSLQIRLRERDEIPGTSINYADIRYATTGINIEGVPGNSPFFGESSEVESHNATALNNTVDTAQHLGNLLETAKSAISVSGNLSSLDDVDWFTFDIDYQNLSQRELREYLSTVFDIDNADGIGGPDTSLYVFKQLTQGINGAPSWQLALSGLGSNVVGDGAFQGASRDPFVGSYELQGRQEDYFWVDQIINNQNFLGTGRYAVAVTSSRNMPTIINSAYTAANSTAALLRMRPMESLQLLAKTTVDTFSFDPTVVVPPVVPVLFDSNTIVPFNLSDVGLYISSGARNTRFDLVNPFTGEFRATSLANQNSLDVNDIAFTNSGVLQGFDSPKLKIIPPTADRDGELDFVTINLANGTFAEQDAAIQTSHLNITDPANPTVVASNDGVNVEAITYATLDGNQVGLISTYRPTPATETPSYDTNTGLRDGVVYRNYIYQIDEDGQAYSGPRNDYQNTAIGQNAGTEIRERGFIQTTTGIIRGMTTIGTNAGTRLYAISDTGEFFEVTLINDDEVYFGQGAVTQIVAPELDGINFSALTRGPNVTLTGDPSTSADDIDLSQALFGLTDDGILYAFTTAGELLPIFANGQNNIQIGGGRLEYNGLAFSKSDTNLWHVTTDLNGDVGHGYASDAANGITGGALSGGSSFYFGLEPNNDPEDNNYNLTTGAAGVMESNSIDLSAISSADLPTLYFNYYLETENVADTPNQMVDAFRVYAAGADGQWKLLSSNNGRERDSTSQIFETRTRNIVGEGIEEAFDNTDQWRQVRVSLVDLAGQSDVRIRVEFSTAGGFGYGLSGGKGPEIRTVAGSQLFDGQTFTVNGQLFEIELGQTAVMPSGSAITNGDTITIDGVNFVFTDGTFTVTGPDIAVPFAVTDTPSDIATSLSNALLLFSSVTTVLPGISEVEGNETIAAASPTGLTGASASISIAGSIGPSGDTALTPDVDFYQFDLKAGGSFNATAAKVFAASQLFPYLRIFDSTGVEVAAGADTVNFISADGGTYYLGLSHVTNISYAADVTTGRTAGEPGDYTLDIEIVQNLEVSIFGNRVQITGAENISSTSVSGGLVIDGAAGTTGSIMKARINMTAEEVAGALQKSLADALAGGVRYAFPIRSGNTVELTGAGSTAIVEGGPFGVTTSFDGDIYGRFSNGNALSANNDFKGVYIDDFIVGLAAYGEVVDTGDIDSAANQFVTTFTQYNFVDATQIYVGDYQLEIRKGQEYGAPFTSGMQLNDGVLIGERLLEGTSLQFKNSWEIIPGTTFSVSDGLSSYTFEFDLVEDGIGLSNPSHIAISYQAALNASDGIRGETAAEIANRFIGLINSLNSSGGLKLSAVFSNGGQDGVTSDTVAIIGQAIIGNPDSAVTESVATLSVAENADRPQGQLIISNTRVSRSTQFGVSISAASRDETTGNSQSGSPINYITANSDRLATGAVVMNSLLVGNLLGGINVSGDTGSADQPLAAVPFVRLINNTIVGGSINLPAASTSAIYQGQFFASGAISFADEVVSRSTPSTAPIAGLNDAAKVLGVPDYTKSTEPVAGDSVLSLGRGGQVVVKFTNNLLTGSGDSNPDLYIFEKGDSEQFFVDVSADGVNFTRVGTASSTSPTIDIDAAGFNRNSRLAYVRLTDVSGQGSISGDSVGADIDAIGALSTVSVPTFSAGGTGISVTNNATATLLNNVLVNNAIGLQVDATSTSTVVGGTVFQNNTANTGGSANIGQFSTLVDNATQLFLNAGAGNFAPSSNSKLIDAGINSLQDRANFAAFKSSLSIPASPILAPVFDIDGKLRTDDTSISGQAGLGENVFIDAGAVERNDSSGPSVVMILPADNDVEGIDQNDATSIISLLNISPQYFDIRLNDGDEASLQTSGSGIDHSTVTSSSVLIFRNGVALIEGTDYRFGYDSTNGVIRLTPLAGVWQSDAQYSIRFLNSSEASVTATAGTAYADADQFSVIDANGLVRTFEVDLGWIVSIPSAGGVASITEGSTLNVDDGSRRLTFEFDSDGVVTGTNIPVGFSSVSSADTVATALTAALQTAGMTLTIADVGDGILQIRGNRNTTILASTSGFTVTGSSGVQTAYGIQLPVSGGAPINLVDGATFTVTRGSSTATFEFDNNNVVGLGRYRIAFSALSTLTTLSNDIVTVLNSAGLTINASNAGGGLILFGNGVGLTFDAGTSGITQSGVAGQAASIPVEIDYSFTAEEAAAFIKQAIENAAIPSTAGGTLTITQIGNRLIVEGSRGLAGDGTSSSEGIADLAGNLLRANRENGQTVVTVSLSEGYDYGDAASPYASSAASNGPRHTVISGLSIGTTNTLDAGAQLDNADTDDGVTFSGMFRAFGGSMTINVTNTTGGSAYLSAWIDFNGNGVFESTEQLAVSQAVTSSTVTLFPSVPVDAATGTVYARIRLSSDATSVASPIGIAPDGEVEDYAIPLIANPYQNQTLNVDVNGDGFVSPIDVLQVINWINDPAKPNTLSIATATNTAPFIDVNGDGIVSPVDVSLVINYINARSAAGEGESSEIASPSTGTSADSGTTTVLASDWFNGLESVAPAGRSSVNKGDAALVAVVNDLTNNLVNSSSASSYQAVDLSWADSENEDRDAEETDASFGDDFFADLLGL